MKKNWFVLLNKSKLIYIVIFIISLILAVFLSFNFKNGINQHQPSVKLHAERPTPPEEPLPILDNEELPEISLEYPQDKLFITQERENYVSGELQLIIPSLDIDVSVLSDVEYETLKNSVGLYDYSQLPSAKYNSNVSIAGHRDIYGCEFYSIDKLGDGDVFYLIYKNKKYTYEYLQTDIVSDNDWSPIYSKDFSALTLTSCHPIGTSFKRMIITAKLSDVEDYLK